MYKQNELKDFEKEIIKIGKIDEFFVVVVDSKINEIIILF
jgi:hypothetical protein